MVFLFPALGQDLSQLPLVECARSGASQWISEPRMTLPKCCCTAASSHPWPFSAVLGRQVGSVDFGRKAPILILLWTFWRFFPPRYEKWFEKREKGSEKRSDTCPKNVKPLSRRFIISHRHFLKVFRARQRSGEGVVRRNGCPNGRFWRVRFFSAPLGFALKTHENLKVQRRNGLSKTPFWTTVSPRDAFSAPLAHPVGSQESVLKVPK